MDVCVIPHSNPFGSPVVLFEFMACGKPVVAPDLLPIRDVLVHNQTGLLFPPADRSSLKEALLLLADNASLRSRIGAAARSCILEQHTWEPKVRKILAFHRDGRESQTQTRSGKVLC